MKINTLVLAGAALLFLSRSTAAAPAQTTAAQDLTFTNYGRTPGATASTIDPFPGVNLAGIPTTPAELFPGETAWLQTISPVQRAILRNAYDQDSAADYLYHLQYPGAP